MQILDSILNKLLWLVSPGTLLSILGIGFALGLVILVHELGHYLACLLLKIRVEEFSIGFGKPIKQWTSKKSGTVYSLRMIPLGGYVKPAGEFYAAEADITDPGDFAAKPWYSRAFMVFAGAGMNYVLAFIIFTIVVFSVGLPISNPKLIPPVVGEVIEGYPAQAAGIKKGDTILAVNGQDINNWEELVKTISASQNKVDVQYRQGDKTFDSVMDLGEDKKIGLALAPVYRKAGFFESVKVGAHQCYYWTALSITTIAEKLWARQAPDMAGPIGIFEIVGKGVHSGAEDYFFLIGLISVAIGMFNLFPIPILDGGHIMFFIIEGITRKRIKEKTLMRLSSAGALFLIMLIIYASYGDVMRIRKRSMKQPKAQIEQVQAPAANDAQNKTMQDLINEAD